MTICFTLSCPETCFILVIEEGQPRPLRALAILVVTKSNKRERKKDILFVIGSLHRTLTQADASTRSLALHTYTHSCTHSCTRHFVKLHISKQVPLFLSALTEPHTQIESTVTAYPYHSFFFFFGKQTQKKPKLLCQSSVPQWRHVPQPKTDLFSQCARYFFFSSQWFCLNLTSYKVFYWNP